MLFGGGDRQIHEFFIESAYPGRDVVKKVYEFLCASDANPIEMTQQEIKESLRLQIGGEGVGACEKLLEGAGALDRLEAAENTAAVRLNSDLPTLVDLLPTQAKVRRQVLRALERMVGPRRYQWCYFQPRELLRELTDFDSPSLARNLRELSALAAVDYVPPFRGRAIHIRDRMRRFEELLIDFETLDRHKAAELERIEHMLRFARGRTCRQQHIVSYFGESDAQPCGHCDNCAANDASEQTADARPATPQVLEVARIVLSGVARISRSRRGCGKQLLAQMLCGAQTKPVVRNRLDKLSTFGLLSALRQSEVVQVVDALLIAGLLEQTEIEPFRPVLQLTESGNDVMSGRASLTMDLRLPEAVLNKLRRLRALAKGESSTFDVEANDDDAHSDDLDADLLERLRTWRQATCKAQSVPAYIVLSNAALEELARVRPQSVETLLQVKGIGPAKVRQYGDALMEILHAAVRPPVLPSASHIAAMEGPAEELEHGACEPDVRGSPEEATVADELTSQTPAATVAPSEVSRPSHYWTWRLLKSGYAPQEIAEIRGLSEEVVLDHALRAADSGCEIDASWFMPTALVERIEKVIGPGTPARIRPLLEHLPRGTRWEHVQLVLKARCGATAAR